MRNFRQSREVPARVMRVTLGILTLLLFTVPAAGQSDTPPQIGQPAQFAIGQVADYFNLLTSFRLEHETDALNRGFGESDGKVYQRVFLRQAHNKDFEMSYTARGERDSGIADQTGFHVVRKAPWFYFRSIEERQYLRRKATEEMVASRYLSMERLQQYMVLLQQGARFMISRDRYLDRPVQLYRIVSSTPLDQNPAYDGPPLKSSAQGGQIWVDEASGLVLKLETFTEWELATEEGAAPYHKESYSFIISNIGKTREIEAPEDYRDMAGQSEEAPGAVPFLPGK